MLLFYGIASRVSSLLCVVHKYDLDFLLLKITFLFHVNMMLVIWLVLFPWQQDESIVEEGEPEPSGSTPTPWQVTKETTELPAINNS